MESQNVLIKTILSGIETFVSMVVDGELTDKVLSLIIVVAFILWIYTGVKLFVDAKKRYDMNIFLQVLIFMLGIITGPIGLLFYVLTRPKYTKEEVDFLKTEHKFYFQQASKVIECIHCGVYLLENHEYCTTCGEQNRIKCSNCNVLTNLDDKFCFNCGHEFEERKEHVLKAIEAKHTPALEVGKEIESRPVFISGINISDSIKKGADVVSGISSNFKGAIKGFSTNSLMNLHLKSKEGEVIESEAIVGDFVQEEIESTAAESIETAENIENKADEIPADSKKKSKKKASKNKAIKK